MRPKNLIGGKALLLCLMLGTATASAQTPVPNPAEEAASNLAQAGELRVLLSFDNAGHHVRQIMRNDRGTSIFRKPRFGARDRAVPDFEAISVGLERGSSLLVWLDAQGFVSAVTHEPDPRVSHAPGHITGADGSRVGELKGAWLVTGPADATSLVILLAGNESIGLGFEQWELELHE